MDRSPQKGWPEDYPETAEVECWYPRIGDRYGVRGKLDEEFSQVSKEPSRVLQTTGLGSAFATCLPRPSRGFSRESMPAILTQPSRKGAVSHHFPLDKSERKCSWRCTPTLKRLLSRSTNAISSRMAGSTW